MKCQFLYKLEEIINERIKSRNENSYTYKLYSQGVEKICEKVIEEAGEVIIAALRQGRERFIQEVADLIYHLMVLMYVMNVKIDDICEELKKRHLVKSGVQK